MRVIYCCNFGLRSGYSRAAMDYILALQRVGVELEIQPLLDFDAEEVDEPYRSLLPLVVGHPDHKPIGEPSHAIIHAQPRWALEYAATVRDRHPEALLVAYTTWESWPAPGGMCEALGRRFDCVIVPSEFCRQALLEGGLTSYRLHVIPHCIDPEAWPVRMRSPDRYRFISVLSWNARKAPLLLLKAYLTEFEEGEPVELRILVPSYIPADIELLKIGTQLRSFPNLTIVDKRLDEAAYKQFHLDADCYVTATRGEAWDLPCFDSAFVGNSVIAPAFGGAKDFLQHCPRAVLYSFQLTPAVIPPVVNREGSVTLSGPEFLNGRQVWAEPNLWMLRKRMRRMFEERDKPLPPDCRAEFAGLYSFDTIGRRFAGFLRDFRRA